MRLIDADALKEEVNKKNVVGRFNTLVLIDNAPTVEYTFEEAFQKTVCKNKLYCPKRPKGEYVRKEDVIKLLEKWSDGYPYIEIPTEQAIKGIKYMKGDAE